MKVSSHFASRDYNLFETVRRSKLHKKNTNVNVAEIRGCWSQDKTEEQLDETLVVVHRRDHFGASVLSEDGIHKEYHRTGHQYLTNVYLCECTLPRETYGTEGRGKFIKMQPSEWGSYEKSRMQAGLGNAMWMYGQSSMIHSDFHGTFFVSAGRLREPVQTRQTMVKRVIGSEGAFHDRRTKQIRGIRLDKVRLRKAAIWPSSQPPATAGFGSLRGLQSIEKIRSVMWSRAQEI